MIKFWLEWVSVFLLTIKFQSGLNFHLFLLKWYVKYYWTFISDCIQQMNLIKRNLLNFRKKCCIICMPAYTFGGYIYFINLTYHTEIQHIVLILNHRCYMYITSPLKFLAETFLSFPKIFIKEIIKLWINANIQIVAQSFKINVCNKHSQKWNRCIMEEINWRIFWVVLILQYFTMS